MLETLSRHQTMCNLKKFTIVKTTQLEKQIVMELVREGEFTIPIRNFTIPTQITRGGQINFISAFC